MELASPDTPSGLALTTPITSGLISRLADSLSRWLIPVSQPTLLEFEDGDRTFHAVAVTVRDESVHIPDDNGRVYVAYVPADKPATALEEIVWRDAMERWIEQRPEIAKLPRVMAYVPTATVGVKGDTGDRRSRGRRNGH
jgi:hypothetical protein